MEYNTFYEDLVVAIKEVSAQRNGGAGPKLDQNPDEPAQGDDAGIRAEHRKDPMGNDPESRRNDRKKPNPARLERILLDADRIAADHLARLPHADPWVIRTGYLTTVVKSLLLEIEDLEHRVTSSPRKLKATTNQNVDRSAHARTAFVAIPSDLAATLDHEDAAAPG